MKVKFTLTVTQTIEFDGEDWPDCTTKEEALKGQTEQILDDLGNFIDGSEDIKPENLQVEILDDKFTPFEEEVDDDDDDDE